MKSVLASFVLILLVGPFPSLGLSPTKAELDEAIETLATNRPDYNGYKLSLILLESADAQTLQTVSIQREKLLHHWAFFDILAYAGDRLSPAQLKEFRAVADSWGGPNDHRGWIRFITSYGSKDDIPRLKQLLASSDQREAFDALVEIAPIEDLKAIALQFPNAVPENSNLLTRPQAEEIIRSIEAGPKIPAAPFRRSKIRSFHQALLMTTGAEHKIMSSLLKELSMGMGWSILRDGVKEAGAGAVQSLLGQVPLHHEIEDMISGTVRSIAKAPTALPDDQAEPFRQLAKRFDQRPSPSAPLYLMFSRQ